MTAPVKALQTQANPFRLDDSAAYNQWRESKLTESATSAADLLVPVCNPAALSVNEYNALIIKLQKYNMAVFECEKPAEVGKEVVRQLGRQFGLQHLDPNMLADDDGITSLQTEARKSERGYIPYSDKRLLWHTDGYYNPPARQIRAMILYCVQEAASGGDNQLLDHELVYLIIRDEQPRYIEALMHPQAMTIPANMESAGESAGEVRPAQSGPVFSVDPDTGDLHMRYTARTRSIEWKNDAMTREAVACLESILADNKHIICHRLASGQGLLCNNVLHNRTAFENDLKTNKSRLVYRARYYDRISNTHWQHAGITQRIEPGC